MNQSRREFLSKQCPVPSQAQLALAIAIVNSKPANISVIDHLQQICLHIKRCRNQSPSPTNSSDKYFDSVAFWKQAYTKAEAAQSRLNDRIYELEQRVETLKLKLKQEDNICDTPERGKRKGSKDPPVPDPQSKRKKTNNGSASIKNTPEAGLEWLTEMINEENLTEPGINSIMRHMSALQQNLQKRPNWAVIYSTALDLCTATCSIIPFIYDSSASESGRSNNADNNIRMLNPIVVLAVIDFSHTVLCRALNKIMTCSESQKYEGQMTYQIVSLFEAVLLSLTTVCNHKPGSKEFPKIKHSSKSPSSKNRIQQLSAESSNTSHCGISTDQILQTLKRVLAGMMLKASTLITASANSLIEGCLYVFLTRVGTVLSVLEFKDLLISQDLQSGSANLPLPGGLLRSDIVGKAQDIEATMIVYETESYHLVWLLEKAVALVHSISMKSPLSREATTVSGGNDSHAGLLLGLSKKRLQNTLLKAVFHEEEPLFLESLQKPTNCAEDETELGITEKSDSASEWFSREVWRLLGWDILESLWKNGKENHIP